LALLASVPLFGDAPFIRVKEPLSLLTRSSTLAMIHPIDFAGHAYSCLLILGHTPVDALGPREDAALEVLCFHEALFAEQLLGLQAAHAALAVNDDLSFPIQLFK